MATAPQSRGSLDLGSRVPARGGASRIRRFNGLTRRTSDWDGLRRDSQLWFNTADCAVHFSAYRGSQRGPSLKIPFEVVNELDCEYLSNHCLRSHNKLSPISSEDGHSDSGYGSELEKTEYELYIPAPSDLTKDQAFDYHLATRNLFAYAVGKPLVGERLSGALSGVWQRILDWRIPGRQLERFTAYCNDQGYLTLAENSEHALAFLKFAEHARLRDLWIDAFVHCVGMHQRLDLSPEWRGLSNTTVALITRASLEMDLHIARIVRALGGFLEEELGSEHLGLSRQAREHLDRFRSFLQRFYVDKLGYFPPKQTAPWNKTLWARVHRDFQYLYDYLVDKESTCDLNGNRGVTGGVCVVQNLSAFDERHGYEPLPHPLPLMPEVSLKSKRGVSSQRSLRSLTLGMSASAPELASTPRQTLERASNAQDSKVMECSLVQEYQRFERQRLEERLDYSETRKVRWILVYGVLQMLNSIMGAPKEVRDTKTSTYPLCSLTTGCPPWKDAAPVLPEASDVGVKGPETGGATIVPDAMEALEGRTSRVSIRPDCEAENAEQFFASSNISRQPSQAEMNMTPSPLRVNTQLGRRNSVRESMHSSVNLLQKSVLGSLSRCGSSRRNSLAPEPKKMPSFCEIVVEGYGNGLEHAGALTREPDSFEPKHLSPVQLEDPPVNNDFALFDFGLGQQNHEPTLEFPELAESNDSEHFRVDFPDLVDTSPRDSHASDDMALYRVSSHGSIEDPGTPATDVASLDDGDFGIVSNYGPSSPAHPGRASPPQLKLHSYVPSKGDTGSKTSINAGCYTPTGMMAPPRSRFASACQSLRTSSIVSGSSSTYGDEPIQADDIEEENARGRRRSRALDKFASFGVAANSGYVS